MSCALAPLINLFPLKLLPARNYLLADLLGVLQIGGSPQLHTDTATGHDGLGNVKRCGRTSWQPLDPSSRTAARAARNAVKEFYEARKTGFVQRFPGPRQPIDNAVREERNFALKEQSRNILDTCKPGNVVIVVTPVGGQAQMAGLCRSPHHRLAADLLEKGTRREKKNLIQG